MARPTDYRQEYNDLAYKYCLLGASDKDLADFFYVEESTINNWKIAHTEFMESIKRGKELADANVASRLYSRATGYEQKTDKIFQFQGNPVIVPTVEHIAPDTTAAIFWLKNRRPKDWRDKQDIEVSGNVSFSGESELKD